MLSEALRTIIPVLDALQIPYALIGGLALAPHNVVRATEDLDFLVDSSSTASSDLARQFEARGFPSVARKGDIDDPIAAVVIVEIPSSTGNVRRDLILPARRWQREIIRKATPVAIEGTVVRVVRAQDLFLLKLYAGGPQDLLDAANLLRMESPADRAAWKAAAVKLRMGNEYRRCLSFVKETG